MLKSSGAALTTRRIAVSESSTLMIVMSIIAPRDRDLSFRIGQSASVVVYGNS